MRGFVTSYARFVALDPKEVLTRFGTFIDSKAHDRPNRDAGHSGYAFEKREGEQSRTVLWVLMGSFVVLGGVAAVFVKKPLSHSHHGTQVEKLRAAYPASPVPGPGTSRAVVATEPSPSASAWVAVAASPEPSRLQPSPRAPIVAAAVPSPAPVVTAVAPAVVAVVEQKPSPTPVPQVSVAVASEQEEGPNPEDPLNSGLKLKLSEIKYKVVFKALESAWVRYKVDHKPVTQFVFRNGRTLVLRAKESIRFQVSPPKALAFSYKGSGFKPVVGDEHLVTRQNDATLFFPYELVDSTEEVFPGGKPLSKRPVPAPRPTPSLSTPSP